MKNASLLAAALALALVGGKANAEQENNNDNKNKLSVSVGLGVASHTIDASGGYEDESGTDSAYALALNYEFTPNWSASIAYIDYGQADLFTIRDSEYVESVGDVSYKADIVSSTTGLAVYATYHTPRLIKEWSFGGSVGLVSWSTDLDAIFDISMVNSSVEESLASDNDVAVYGALSASYTLTENVDVSFLASWFVNELDSDLIDGESTDMQHALYSVVASYRF